MTTVHGTGKTEGGSITGLTAALEQESVVFAQPAPEGELIHLPHTVGGEEIPITLSAPDILTCIEGMDEPTGEIPGREFAPIFQEQEPASRLQDPTYLPDNPARYRVVQVMQDSKDQYRIEGVAPQRESDTVGDTERVKRKPAGGIGDVAPAPIESEVVLSPEKRSQLSGSTAEVEDFCAGIEGEPLADRPSHTVEVRLGDLPEPGEADGVLRESVYHRGPLNRRCSSVLLACIDRLDPIHFSAASNNQGDPLVQFGRYDIENPLLACRGPTSRRLGDHCDRRRLAQEA